MAALGALEPAGPWGAQGRLWRSDIVLGTRGGAAGSELGLHNGIGALIQAGGKGAPHRACVGANVQAQPGQAGLVGNTAYLMAGLAHSWHPQIWGCGTISQCCLGTPAFSVAPTAPRSGTLAPQPRHPALQLPPGSQVPGKGSCLVSAAPGAVAPSPCSCCLLASFLLIISPQEAPQSLFMVPTKSLCSRPNTGGPSWLHPFLSLRLGMFTAATTPFLLLLVWHTQLTFASSPLVPPSGRVP